MGHGKAKGHSAVKAALGVLALCLFLLALGSAAQAATYEGVGCFAGTLPGLTESCKPVAAEKFGEEVQLGGVGGMAVNSSGAGGVPKGTVYAATHSLEGTKMAMYEPEGDGLKFVERWEVAYEGAYARCGPLLGVNGEGKAEHPCAPWPGGGVGRVDVEVDQETGNVYVYADFRTTPGGEDEVIEYKADGSAVITRFAPQAPSNETVAESPEGVHDESELGPLTINSTGAGGMPKGTVYLADELRGASPYHRLMVFEPESEGDYEHYVYAGEVAAGPGGTGHPPWAPITDEDGNVYVVEERQVGIEEFAPEAPHAYPAPASTPTCKYEFAKGGIVALSVDPRSGEPFFFSYKKEKGFTHKVLHQLGPCEGGKFEETAKVEVTPERDDLYGLAFDPTRALSGRQKGVLYGGAGYGVPQSGVGTGEPGQSALGYVFAPPELEESPPVVEAESVSHVTATTALLHASVNPEGFPTSYRFQYETAAQYEGNPPGERFEGAEEAPPGGAPLGTGKEGLAAAAALASLAPDTTYRYRALATSHCAPAESERLCEVPGEASAFRTFPPEAPGLTDHRAWELVSPAQKHGGQVLPAEPRLSSCGAEVEECKPGANYSRFPIQSTAEGDAIAYEGTPFGEEGAAIENEYISRRDPSTGWQTTNLTPRLLTSKGSGGGYRAFSRDLSLGLLGQRSPALSPAAPPGYEDLYAQPSADPLALSPLLGRAERRPIRWAEQFALRYAGASADLSRVFFVANDALTAETPFAPAAPAVGPSEFDLYEWHEGQLALVNVAPGNASALPDASFGPTSAHTISADGRFAFFEDEGQLYVREDGQATREIPDSGHFLSASAKDGAGSCSPTATSTTSKYRRNDRTDRRQRRLPGARRRKRRPLAPLFRRHRGAQRNGQRWRGSRGIRQGQPLRLVESGGPRFIAQLVAGDNEGGRFHPQDWTGTPSVRRRRRAPTAATSPSSQRPG